VNRVPSGKIDSSGLKAALTILTCIALFSAGFHLHEDHDSTAPAEDCPICLVIQAFLILMVLPGVHSRIVPASRLKNFPQFSPIQRSDAFIRSGRSPPDF